MPQFRMLNNVGVASSLLILHRVENHGLGDAAVTCDVTTGQCPPSRPSLSRADLAYRLVGLAIMKPSGSIAKLSIDFKAALADAQRAGIAGDEGHRSAAADAAARAEHHRHDIRRTPGAQAAGTRKTSRPR